MKHSSKSIHALAAVSMALAACGKMPSECIRNYPPNEICFGSEGIIVHTKAFSEATDASLEESGFKVAAIIDNDGSTMFNKAVTYSDGAYRVAGEHYYFPASGTMSFYAAYPATETITTTGGATTLSYTHDSDKDLIAAIKTAVSGASGPVDLAFEHILSQVSIRASGSDSTVDYKIRSLKISARRDAVYDFTSSIWTTSTATADISIHNGSPLPISVSGKTAVGTAVSVIPGEVKLNVAWDCYNKGSETLLCSQDATVNVTLKQGKNTTLNLSLPFDQSGLTFDASVGEWKSESMDIDLGYEPETVSGVFTVNDSGKTVRFAKGNLYWNGSAFRCEENQYDYPAEWNPNHAGHLYWSGTPAAAYSLTYNDSSPSTGDTFFAADGKLFKGFTVLSSEEWNYITNVSYAYATNSSSENCFVINGIRCIVLTPDGFSGTVEDEYTASEWAEAESSFGLVALPLSGSRQESVLTETEEFGYLWLSHPDSSKESLANQADFDDYGVSSGNGDRNLAKAIRLVKVL